MIRFSKISEIMGGLSAAVLLLAGCNTLSGVPEMRASAAAPAAVKAGENLRVTVEIKDKQHVVDRVPISVKEAPQVRFLLHDDGTNGDTKARDGVWTLESTVPENTPAGKYTLEAAAFSGKKTPVKVREHGRTSELRAEIPVTVLAP